MSLCEFQAIKFSQSQQIFQCTGREINIHLEEFLPLIDPFDFALALASHNGFT